MHPSRSIRILPVAAVLFALLSLGACSPGADTAAATFDPSSPCTTDGQQAGAYPALEALLPTEWGNQQPDSIDSGRTCTAAALGTLAGYGVDELEFAGATWKTGSASGFTMAVFEANGLDTARMLEFYESGARASRPSDTYTRSEIKVGGTSGSRLDVQGADGARQAVVAWPGPGDGQVFVLLTANVGDDRTAELIEAFGNR